MYKWIADYYRNTCPDSKYSHALKEAADTTIVSSVRQYQNSYKLLHGFSKELDILIDREVKGYNAELKYRGLRV